MTYDLGVTKAFSDWVFLVVEKSSDGEGGESSWTSSNNVFHGSNVVLLVDLLISTAWM